MIRHSKLKLLLLCSIANVIMITTFVTTTAAQGTVRYNGIALSTLGVDTSTINSVLDKNIHVALSERVLLVGVEGIAGVYNGWVFGWFGYRGQMSTSRTDTYRTQLGITLGGIAVETLIQDAGRTQYVAGARLGGGKYALKFINVN